jgi:hypothetical protein
MSIASTSVVPASMAEERRHMPSLQLRPGGHASPSPQRVRSVKTGSKQAASSARRISPEPCAARGMPLGQ